MTCFISLIFFFIFSIIITQKLWALQSHGGGEGFVIHQLAHILFAVAMTGVIIIIKKTREFKGKEWNYFSLGAFFLAIWNIWAFIGHYLETQVSSSCFIISQSGVPFLKIDNIFPLLYYVYKMDHIILVPSMIFFFIGLKIIASEKESK